MNPARLSHDVRERLPTESYRVRGVGGSSLGCIPVSGEATHCYLSALYGFDAAIWNRFIAKERAPVVITWRDGESAFLIPDGIDREQSWLAGECGCDRGFLTGRVFHYRENSSLDPHCLRAFPAHAFQPWTKEFRMMGFLASLQRIETEAVDFSVIEETLWLHAINSDVLSSVEKRSPVVKAYRRGESHDEFSHTILRSERGFEGEEYLHALACLRDGDQGPVAVLLASSEAYAVKFRGRLDYLRELGHRD